MGKVWLNDMEAKYGKVPQEFIDDHVKHCRKKRSKGHVGRVRCAVSLYYDAKELGVEPPKSHFDLEELRNHDKHS